MTRPLLLLVLALAVLLAVPLALDSFLRGGHVTPEQGLRHRAAVAQRGAHAHEAADTHVHHEHDAVPAVATAPPASLRTDAGPSLLPDTPTLVAGAWVGLLVTIAAVLATLVVGPAGPAPRSALADMVVAVPSPPPRG